MDVYDVVEKLVGPVRPVGESTADGARFHNLGDLTELIDRLVSLVRQCEEDGADRKEYSMRKIGIYAREWLDELQTSLGDRHDG